MPGCRTPRLVLDRAGRLAQLLLRGPPTERREAVLKLIDRVAIEETAVSIALRQPLLAEPGAIPAVSARDTILISGAVWFRRRGAEIKLVLSAGIDPHKPGRIDAALVKAIARGRL